MLDRLHHPLRRFFLPSAVAAFCLAIAVLQGCEKPLLSPTEERTPFDRYDAVRAQAASQYTEDKFGHRQPNLRERLGPKDN